jgi:hypothetical protein
MPNKDDMPDRDENAWELGPNNRPRDPWQNTRFVYLVDPETAEAFTFSTSTYGGRDAVSELAEQIQRMRFARPGAAPIVELRSAPMKTDYGMKSKPVLKVVGWTDGGAVSEAVSEEPKAISPPAKAGGDLNDEIPF